jgi:hypothetical protein
MPLRAGAAGDQRRSTARSGVIGQRSDHGVSNRAPFGNGFVFAPLTALPQRPSQPRCGRRGGTSTSQRR